MLDERQYMDMTLEQYSNFSHHNLNFSAISAVIIQKALSTVPLHWHVLSRAHWM